MHQGLIHTCICIEDSLAIQIFRIRRTISLSLIGFKEYLHITKHFFNENNQSLSRNKWPKNENNNQPTHPWYRHQEKRNKFFFSLMSFCVALPFFPIFL